MKIVFSIKIYISIPKFNEIRRQVQKLELFQCLKRSVSVNVLANSQALYITNGNVTRYNIYRSWLVLEMEIFFAFFIELVLKD